MKKITLVAGILLCAGALLAMACGLIPERSDPPKQPPTPPAKSAS